MKTRAFIAINLPDDIKKDISVWLTKPKNSLNGNIKWVNPENIHLTLHFLGYLGEDKLNLVKQILEVIVKAGQPVFLEIKSYGCFPNENRPRVLFLNCCELDGDCIIDIQKKLGQELKKLGIKVDSRPWKMHFTFARLRKPTKIPLVKFKGFKQVKFKVESIDLMKSELRRTGPIYTIIKKFLI